MTGKQAQKAKLFEAGTNLVAQFCDLNRLPLPEIKPFWERGRWQWGMCAYYRQHYIAISIPHCANIGTAGRAWSFPGHHVDRTPYGVLAHEMGHAFDCHMGNVVSAYVSEYSAAIRKESRESKLTNYCPNDGEWFAEMFRLFLTNPDYLKHFKPRTFAAISADAKAVEERTALEVLANAPQRTIAIAKRNMGITGND